MLHSVSRSVDSPFMVTPIFQQRKPLPAHPVMPRPAIPCSDGVRHEMSVWRGICRAQTWAPDSVGKVKEQDLEYNDHLVIRQHFDTMYGIVLLSRSAAAADKSRSLLSPPPACRWLAKAGHTVDPHLCSAFLPQRRPWAQETLQVLDRRSTVKLIVVQLRSGVPNDAQLSRASNKVKNPKPPLFSWGKVSRRSDPSWQGPR